MEVGGEPASARWRRAQRGESGKAAKRHRPTRPARADEVFNGV